MTDVVCGTAWTLRVQKGIRIGNVSLSFDLLLASTLLQDAWTIVT